VDSKIRSQPRHSVCCLRTAERPFLLSTTQGQSLVFEQRALAARTPAISRDRTVLFENTVTRHQNRDWISTDRYSHVARAQLRRERSVARRLADRDFAKQIPHLDFIRSAAQVQFYIGRAIQLVYGSSYARDSSATTPLPDAAIIISPRDILPNAYPITSLIAAPSEGLRCITRDQARSDPMFAFEFKANKMPLRD
jgi:hypothetical protein